MKITIKKREPISVGAAACNCGSQTGGGGGGGGCRNCGGSNKCGVATVNPDAAAGTEVLAPPLS